ncbi:SUMF1/EgtB/PvdO family nonheme iron enzyme [Candidatus Latescibacterota bacterium]
MGRLYNGVIACLMGSLVFFTFTANASVTVKVVDTTGNPISGANVIFTNPDNNFSGFTDSDGSYSIDLPLGVQEDDTAKPQAFSLGQNYPNPFNPSTIIPFIIEQSGNVKIDIFNNMGQHIRTLIDGYYNSGSHTIVWDACDNNGNHLSAGIYIYRLIVSGAAVSNKMLLLDGSGGSGSGASYVAKSANSSGRNNTAKIAEGTTYTVTVTHDSILPYEETVVIVYDKQSLHFIIPLKGSVIKEITFVSIPAGTFQMGDWYGDLPFLCRPVHTVTLSTFEMSIYEVTNAQYAKYLNDALISGDISVSDLVVTGASGDWSGQEYYDLSGVNVSPPRRDCKIVYNDSEFNVKSGFENWPVTWVSWYGSKSFAEYYGFDLPREAEWEYACRGGEQYKFGTDDGTISPDKVNYWDTDLRHPVDVGSYPANPFGLHDMSGNVIEWCNDWVEYYTSESAENPIGPPTGSDRVIRGGSWGVSANNCQSAVRFPYGPPHYTDYYSGFRVVRR